MNKHKIPILTLVALLVLSSAVIAYAQTGNGFDLTWWTVDGGGGTLEGGGYTLAGTVGQPEPGPASTGGGFTLSHGFWPAAAGAKINVYIPMVFWSPPK